MAKLAVFEGRENRDVLTPGIEGRGSIAHNG
jgi:hypothetical protein